MPVNMRQLANDLDVAPSTVSRVLAGQGGSSPTRAREIRAYAAKLGYRPRPLRRKVNKTIGLLIADDGQSGLHAVDAYQLELMSQVMAVLGETDWHLHFEKSSSDDQLPRLVAENRVDGLILCDHPSPVLCRRVRDVSMPAVVMDDLPKRTGLPCVIADVAPATAQIVEQLGRMGHRRIAMVVTPQQYPTVERRAKGYWQGLKRADLKPDERLLVRVGGSTLQQGQVAVRQLLELVDRPTAIVFATDRLATGGIIELAQAGLKVPRDVSIVGHDNTSLGRELDPALTSVDLNLPGSISQAFEYLKGIIQSHVKKDGTDGAGDPLKIEIESRVIWRASCGPARC